MKFKLLILDIDGTLVEPSGEALPSDNVIESVKSAQKKLHVAVATGRPYPYAKPVIDALQLEGLGVVNGGAEIVEMESGNVVYSKKISQKNLREILRVSRPFGYKMYLSSDQFGTPYTSPEQITGDTEKFFIGAVKITDSTKMLEEINGLDGVNAHPAKSWTKGEVVDILVTHAQATKRHGVELLIKMLGYTKEETVAIGDDYNDVPLMMAAGFKVAMGDAPREVEAIADFITGTLEGDGVAVAIEKLILV